jgi:two-component system, chemotaxis family, CheB/CheR fusion protein
VTTDTKPAGRKPSGSPAPDLVEPDAGSRSCVVAGIGASAGGLEAFSALLEKLPADTGMAFVFVQHLDPHYPSLLTHLLAAKTAMSVTEVTDGMPTAPDHVYVVPPGVDMVLEGGRLKLTPRQQIAGRHLPIDGFLRSMAADLGELACGVILSGAASDGTQGLAAIKSEGGVTFAQEPASADYPSMPATAIAARVVDFVLPPQEIATELARLARDPRLAETVLLTADAADADDELRLLDEVFALLRDAFRVDFSAYKLPTIRRRLARRTLLRRSADLGEYVALLRSDPAEVETLYRDILIMVTEFFRDPETFAVLREMVLPAIFKAKSDGDSVRIWVPGCASGEEAYGLAITALDVMEAQGRNVPVKIFATDIDEPDLQRARRGAYAQSISAQVAPDLLRRYFVATEGGYQVSKTVRDICVFARHDVTADPPFPRLDLVSCRNLLIYLGPALQRRVIPSLHYGLLAEGYLVLGRSESIAGSAALFETVDKKHKIFKKHASSVAGSPLPLPVRRLERASTPDHPSGADNLVVPHANPSVRQQADKAALAAFAPAGVTVDSQYGIVEFRGDTAPYLANRPGRPSLNLLDLVRDDLTGSVRAGLAEAARTGAKVELQGIHLGKGRSRRTIDLHVLPFNANGAMHHLVLFEEIARPSRAGGRPAGAAARRGATEAGEVQRLHDDLTATRERLEAVISDKEAINEELRAANEEMLSSGEEMQSINEELETTHEELQSTNEELRSRNVELGQVGDDLSNLLASVSFPIVMVDRGLRIRRFTPAAARLLKVIHGDVGRPITDLRLPIEVPDLAALLGEVIDTMTLREREVQDDQGRWYVMQARPYETADNRIDGAVVTLFDIDEMTRRFAVQKRIATTLQENFIHELPVVPGLELGVVALAATQPELVGGDFSDVFLVDDSHVVVLIGDVAGKGVRAAGHTETVRSVVRTLASIDPSPTFVLGKTNDLLLRYDSDEPHVTAFLAVLDPHTGHVDYASAGHPAPVHLGAFSARLLDVVYGPPLGSFAQPLAKTAHAMLTLEDYLVLYTDGVTEARREDDLFGEERLLKVVSQLRGRSAQEVAEGVRDAALAFGGRLGDDLQVVVLRLA